MTSRPFSIERTSAHQFPVTRPICWCGVDAVRRLAAGRVGPTWDRDFERMLTYAAGKGWLSNDGTSIRAHLERC
jgi:hypothetical protein